MDKTQIESWEVVISWIRLWDRREHDWAAKDKSLDHKNRKTKESLIKDLMKEFNLKKK